MKIQLLRGLLLRKVDFLAFKPYPLHLANIAKTGFAARRSNKDPSSIHYDELS